MDKKSCNALLLLTVAYVASLVSRVSCANQAVLQYATSAAGPFNRLGVVQVAAMDDDMRSQVHVDGLSSDDMSSLRHLARDENSRLYIAVATESREKNSNNVVTSIALCRLIQAGFALNLTVTLDATETVVGLYAHTKTEWCSDSTRADGLQVDLADGPLRIRVITNYCEHGIQPDSDRFLGKIEREQFEKEQKGDDRSFLSKYWMYIVPGIIIYFVMQAGDAAGGGGAAARS